MTILVGILCQDGIVIGSDSSATLSAGNNQTTIEQKTSKINVVNDHIIIAGTGSVGFGQRFDCLVTKAWEERFFIDKSKNDIAKGLCRAALEDYASTFIEPGRQRGVMSLTFGALLAFHLKDKFHLCEFAVDNFQPEFKTLDGLWYTSMGCGQQIVDPFLGFIRNVFWKDTPPKLNDGIFAACWAIKHCIDINPGGIGGPHQIAIIERKRELVARLLDDDEIGEHLDNVNGVHEHIAKYKDIQKSVGQPLPKL